MIFCMIIYFHIEERQSEEITNYLRQTINDKTITAGNACMSNTKNIIKYFTNVKAVGKGSFGTVYIGNINIKNNVFSIAIKRRTDFQI